MSSADLGSISHRWVVIPLVGGYPPDGWLYPLALVVIPLGWVVIPPTSPYMQIFTEITNLASDVGALSQLFRAFAMFRPLHMVVRVLTAKWV